MSASAPIQHRPPTSLPPVPTSAVPAPAAAPAARCAPDAYQRGARADAPTSIAPVQARCAAPKGTLGTFTSGDAGFNTNSQWFDTGKEVIVFDAQFDAKDTQALIDQIHSRTSSPIKYVVVTHPNPDKFNGAKAFQAEGAQIVMSRETANALHDVHQYKKDFFIKNMGYTEETYPKEPTPDLVFDDHLELPPGGDLAGPKVELQELHHPGVSSNQTVAYLPSQRALIVGDLVHHGTHAWLEGGIVGGAPKPALDDWRKDLVQLASTPEYEGATVYGGRGTSAPLDQAVDDQLAYLDGMEGLVKGFVAEKGPEAFLGGGDTSALYQELAQRAHDAYPELGLQSLIQYGAYGLATTVARQLAAPKGE